MFLICEIKQVSTSPMRICANTARLDEKCRSRTSPGNQRLIERSLSFVRRRLNPLWQSSAKPTRLVTVAIANKTARTAWALLAKREDYKAVTAI
jgi:hypothetical protein